MYGVRKLKEASRQLAEIAAGIKLDGLVEVSSRFVLLQLEEIGFTEMGVRISTARILFQGARVMPRGSVKIALMKFDGS